MSATPESFGAFVLERARSGALELWRGIPDEHKEEVAKVTMRVAGLALRYSLGESAEGLERETAHVTAQVANWKWVGASKLRKEILQVTKDTLAMGVEMAAKALLL